MNFSKNSTEFHNFIADITSEQMLIQRLAELQVKLQYLDSMYRARQEDLQQLTQHIDQIGIPGDNTTATFSFPTAELRPEIKQLIKNMSGMHAATGVNPPIMLRLPSSYHFLPHLLDDPSSLRLAYLMSKGRNGVSVVMGVPTVRREKQSYLMDTLQNLIDGMTSAEANDSLIVVFVAEVSVNRTAETPLTQQYFSQNSFFPRDLSRKSAVCEGSCDVDILACERK
jgi:alpha-1,3-mannosylglycoprotein beta-1,4-N-acetylglucosaminyltransferase A/B